MAIDTSMYANIRPVAPVQTTSPLETISAFAQLEAVREQTAARRLAGEKARQQAADDAAIRRVLTETNGDIEAALPRLRAIAPEATLKLETEIATRKTKTFEGLKNEMEYRGKQLETGLKLAQGMAGDATSYRAGLPALRGMSPDLAKILPDDYDPDLMQRLIAMGSSAADVHKQRQEGFTQLVGANPVEGLSKLYKSAQNQEQWDKVTQGAQAVGVKPEMLTLFGQTHSPEAVQHAATLGISSEKAAELAGQAETRAQTAANQAATREQAAHSPAYKEWQDYRAQGGPLEFDAYMTKDANRKATRITVTGQGGPEDIKDAVQGMIDGRVPPMLPGRASTAYTAMLAEAQRRGYNLAGAATDWMATQKHIATMNGAQQLRLNQAVNALPDMLDKVDTLAQQWKGSGAPILNRANLALAKNGVYGTKAATIATQLDTQIADVVADLGNVYMGGNSPTDHALQLAGKSLQADWSEPVLRQMITLAKDNVRIRRNSINNTGVAGASEGNPYMPAAPAPPATTTGTPRVGERRSFNGRIGEWDGRGWKAVP